MGGIALNVPQCGEIDRLIRDAQRKCVGIGLQTYGRKPQDMNETPQWWKLQRAEAQAREIEAMLAKLREAIFKA